MKEPACGWMHHPSSASNAQRPLGKSWQDAAHWNEAVLLLCHALDFDAQVLHPENAKQRSSKSL